MASGLHRRIESTSYNPSHVLYLTFCRLPLPTAHPGKRCQMERSTSLRSPGISFARTCTIRLIGAGSATPTTYCSATTSGYGQVSLPLFSAKHALTATRWRMTTTTTFLDRFDITHYTAELELCFPFRWILFFFYFSFRIAHQNTLTRLGHDAAAVVRQPYEVKVESTDVTLGNTAFLKCFVSSHVREFVHVSSWFGEKEMLLPGRSDIGE